jgi:DNA-binding SARP family transcriptional activator
MERRWRVELLGRLRAARGAQEITHFRTQKTAVLFAYLAYYPHRPHPRGELMELLWPEHRVDAARANLSNALSWLRRQLRSQLDESSGWRVERMAHAAPSELSTLDSQLSTMIIADHASIQLNPALFTTDVAEFEVALQTAARAAPARGPSPSLIQAVELYRGELLPGCFEAWVLQERQWLAERYFLALSQLLRQLEAAGDFERALQYAQYAVRADPLREEVHRELIRRYAASGQPVDDQRLAAESIDGLNGSEAPVEHRLGVSSSVSDKVRGHRPPTPDVHDAICAAQHSHPRSRPVGGVVPLDSPFYVLRSTDEEFRVAIAHCDSVVLIKGARQMGKTSLLARGLQQARAVGIRVVLTDLQMIDSADLASLDRLYLTLADTIAFQLKLDVLPEQVWKPHLGASTNFERYLQREVLGNGQPLVWGLDEVDRLFSYDYSSQVFGLFRSWHNRRGLDPTGPWSQLTLAIAYASEAHLFITDMNQSPFNVGTQLTLQEFTAAQVLDLNQRYGAPLREDAQVDRYQRLVNGHPYLVSRGFQEMVTHGLSMDTFAAQADRDDGIFGDHLRRMLVFLVKDATLGDAVRALLRGEPCRAHDSFYRLRSAGVVAGEAMEEARLRCPIYATYLERHLL